MTHEGAKKARKTSKLKGMLDILTNFWSEQEIIDSINKDELLMNQTSQEEKQMILDGCITLLKKEWDSSKINKELKNVLLSKKYNFN